MNTFIVGISGNNGAGKDTLAKMLQDKLQSNNVNVQVAAFADALYSMCTDLFDTKPKSYYDEHPDRKELQHTEYQTVRDLLILTGRAIRKVHANFWVEVLQTSISNECQILLLTDVRFDNEDAICNMRIAVDRPGHFINVGKVYDQGSVADNSGTLTDLDSVANTLAAEILSQYLDYTVTDAAYPTPVILDNIRAVVPSTKTFANAAVELRASTLNSLLDEITAYRKRIVFAEDLEKCECCGEPYCEVHHEHYADCLCQRPDGL